MRCYLSRNYKGVNSAGNKAKTDMESVMRSMGFKNVGLPQSRHTNSVAHFLKTLAGVLKAPFCLRRSDVLVLQYPLKKYYEFVCDMAHLRGARVVTLIHDLGSFRRKALTVPREMRRLGHSDAIIALNESMKAWLERNGCQQPIVSLGIWDYLSEGTATQASGANPPYVIVYAGALSHRKNAFLYEWGGAIRSYKVRLYGNGFDIGQAQGRERIEQMGFVPSDQLITTARGHFGLVWDGSSLDACEGNFGEYLKYNNPHKTSLYIRCHLPVIIWSQAALAPFVREKGIGLCVDSLRDIDAALASLTPERYAEMRRRVEALSQELAGGHYFRTAVGRAIDLLSKRES